MVRERATACSSGNSGDNCSSSSFSSSSSSSISSSGETSTTSSSSSSSFSSASSRSSGDNARSRSYKRCRRKTLSSKSHSSTNRKNARRHNGKEHASYERGKKRRKLRSNVESNAKLDRKEKRRRPKKRKLDMEMEGAKKVPSLKEKKIHKSRDVPNDLKADERRNNLLEVALNAQEQQKALIRHNAEIAKARLESGELQRAREEQRKMHQLYGTVDWRANKKLRTEKKILERTVAAGKRLASLEQREYARMDAFRVALGLPTAEAQRQAEWRREATQALAELENGSKTTASNNRCKKTKQGLIGPMLPP